MKVKMSCSTNNFLSLEQDFKFLSFEFTSNSDTLRNEILIDFFKKAVGEVGTRAYKEGPFFYTETEFNSEGLDGKTENQIVSDNTNVYYIIFETFISFLWLIKDNCCSINSFHTYTSVQKNVLLKNNSFLYSTSKGLTNEKIFFSNSDLIKAINYYLRSRDFFYYKHLRIHKVGEIMPNVIEPRIINAFDYTKINRIERAFHFLTLARTSHQLPLKISFYMCIYEALFYGTSQGEIVHQIAERVALYAANVRFRRLAVYKQIKEAYKVRSTYFHGNSLKKFSIDKLEKISFYIDNLTRHVLVKIINNDSAKFLQDDMQLEKSFQDLLFEDERKPNGVTFESGITHLRFNS